MICRVVPREATVAVISKGDRRLVDLDGRQGWHFPQRADGVYAGYYPADDAAARTHVEDLRAKGAAFLAIPASALWWLEHYPEFARHLAEHYRRVVEDEDVGTVFQLAHGGPPSRLVRQEAPPPRPTPSRPPLREVAADDLHDSLRTVIDVEFYATQAELEFTSKDDALVHYLLEGYLQGYDPHPLFDTSWYLDCDDMPSAEPNPLLHFLRDGAGKGRDPGPYFDTDFYHLQGYSRDSGANALLHYLTQAPHDRAYRPNPLFGGGYYFRMYPDVKAAGLAPLTHYVRFGASEQRYVSDIHENLLHQLRSATTGGLTRGDWRRGSVLLFQYGDRAEHEPKLSAVAEALLVEHRVDPLVVAHRCDRRNNASEKGLKSLVLEDYAMACEIFRPSAQRLLARGLAARRPLFAVTEVAEVVEVLEDAGVGTYYLQGEQDELEDKAVRRAYERATRVFVSSPGTFHASARALGHYPPRVARRLEGLPSVLRIAVGDLGLDQRLIEPRAETSSVPTKKVIIPCSDWNVSGVNASLEAVGSALLSAGWDVEIVFTRGEEAVLGSAVSQAYLPRVPHRFLKRSRPGLEGMWEALISDLQSNAPCIAFLGYDFLANGVASALTEDVGVVSWVQADDGDYYEQSYRIGPYCNQLVCVSSRIRDKVVALNPLLEERTAVIHNSSVWKRDVASRRPSRGKGLRIVYAGRLVQYQKRVLDYIDLAGALDATGTPYEISLIGSFATREGVEDVFRRGARDHLEDGRIKLLGRLPREDILRELTHHDFYVLLSDFEGLPLAIVEAMARGCVPVTPSIESGIPELITDGTDGIIVDHRDYDAWATLLVQSWQDRRRLAALSRNARSTVRKRFTMEHVGQAFGNLFSEVAAEIASGSFQRPPALVWGDGRAPAGDVLPPPSLHRPAMLTIAGLGG